MKQIIYILSALILSIILILGLRELSLHFRVSNFSLLPTIITACATILVGIGAAIISHNKIKSREIEEKHRQSKINLYNEFNAFLFRIISGPNDHTSIESPSEQEMIDFMAEFKNKLLFVASPEVIKTMIAFEVNSGHGNNNVLLYMDDILVAMRKDVGLPIKSLRNNELIQVFLTNDGKKDLKKLKK
ncbi:MAG: hypothetical protein ACO1N0_14880 [Fluviicola sp.]